MEQRFTKTDDDHNLSGENINRVIEIIRIFTSAVTMSENVDKNDDYIFIPFSRFLAADFALADVEQAIRYANEQLGTEIQLYNRDWLDFRDPLAAVLNTVPHDNFYTKKAQEYIVVGREETLNGYSKLLAFVQEHSKEMAGNLSTLNYDEIFGRYKLSKKKRKLLEFLISGFTSKDKLVKGIPTKNIYKLVNDTNSSIESSGYRIKAQYETTRRKGGYELTPYTNRKTKNS